MELYSNTATDESGNVVNGASVSVTISASGLPATIYDKDGGALANPFLTGYDRSKGEVEFQAVAGLYNVTVTGNPGATKKNQGLFDSTSNVTLDIDGGTIDNTVIGGTTPAAGTFTALTSNGIDDNATSTAITIDTSENVGIGTVSPEVRLDVRDAVGTSTSIVNLKNITGASASNIVRTSFFSSNTFGGLEEIASITAINPNAGGNNGGQLEFGTSLNGTSTTPTTGMTIDNSGNVGIGTDSPTEKLDVAGTVKTTSLYLYPSSSSSAPSHSADIGVLWVTSAGVLYINTSGSTAWTKVGAQ